MTQISLQLAYRLPLVALILRSESIILGHRFLQDLYEAVAPDVLASCISIWSSVVLVLEGFSNS